MPRFVHIVGCMRLWLLSKWGTFTEDASASAASTATLAGYPLTADVFVFVYLYLCNATLADNPLTRNLSKYIFSIFVFPCIHSLQLSPITPWPRI